jgi:hypothetical protein
MGVTSRCFNFACSLSMTLALLWQKLPLIYCGRPASNWTAAVAASGDIKCSEDCQCRVHVSTVNNWCHGSGANSCQLVKQSATLVKVVNIMRAVQINLMPRHFRLYLAAVSHTFLKHRLRILPLPVTGPNLRSSRLTSRQPVTFVPSESYSNYVTAPGTIDRMERRKCFVPGNAVKNGSSMRFFRVT